MSSFKPKQAFAASAALLIGLFFAGCPSQASTIVRFDTVLGDIDVRLYDTATPLSVDNFMGYVNRGDYQDTVIHRSDPGFVIQAGRFTWSSLIEEIVAQPAVTNEPGISNLRGTLSYARAGGQVNSATREWFFNLDDNTGLDTVDEGFTVFGRVLGNGMDVIDSIADLPTIFREILGGDPSQPNLFRAPVMEDYNDGNNGVGADPLFPSDVVIISDIVELTFDDGDYNFDGVVNIADYNVWRNAFGSTTEAEADGNGDGVVDQLDYIIWRDALGQVGSALEGGATVPEPASIVVCLVGFALLPYTCRR